MSANQLIGREAPLAALSAAITAAGDHGDAILLAGERGIGKTACLLAAQEIARAAGSRVVCTAGSTAESALPFAGLHSLLQPLLTMADALPLVQRRGLLGALGMQDGPHDLFVISLATLSLLSEAARDRPLLVSVDDLEWLDEESRHVLQFVARRLDRHVVIVATSARPPAAGGAFRELLVARLGDAAARQLLRQYSADLEQADLDWVVSHAAGSPLALTELAAMPPAARVPRTDPFGAVLPVSPLLERAFADRLHELAGVSRDAVLVAALAYDDSLQEVLAATALLSGQRLTTAVLELPQSLGLLRYDETHVHFAHPLTRSAIAQNESLSRRQAAHRALGEAVVVNFSRRVWHRANGAAGCDDSVAAELEAISAVSTRRGDTTAALMALERAAQLSTASTERGRRLLLAAQQATGMRLLGTVDRLLALVDREELSTVDRVRADLLRTERGDAAVGDSSRILQLCASARQAAAGGDHGLAVELAYAAGIRRFAAHVSARAVSALTSLADDLARGREDPGALVVLALADPVRHGRHVISRLPGTEDETVDDAQSLAALAGAAYAVGDYPRGSEFADRAEAALRRHGPHGGLVPLLCGGAEIQLDLGDWHRAGAALAEAGALTADSDRSVYRPHVLSTAAKAAALRGDAATALELIAEAEHCPAVRRGSSILARAQTARGIAYLSSGRHLDAYTVLSRVFDPKDPGHHFREQYGAVMYLAEAAARSGHHDGARAIMDRMAVTAKCSGSPLLLTQLRYARAVLAPDHAAEELFLDCLASDLASWPWPRARAQLAYGRWLRRQRQVRRSRAPLQAAQSALERLGAVSWAREARDELEAAGAGSEDRSTELPAVLLSVQELKVSRLAAQGLSNHEIGEHLCLSPRTVGSHLYRIFPKLDITARGQLAARLAELQLAGHCDLS